MSFDDFNKYYSQVYGERWDGLKKSLEGKESKVALCRPGRDCSMLGDSISSLIYESGKDFLPPIEKNYDYYLLDKASAMIPIWFPIRKKGAFLDMCAAPGGKSLGYLYHQRELMDSIQLNELSSLRRGRLKKVIENYTDDSIKITGFDGVKFGLHRKNYFDFIVLDAPCGSEGHLLDRPEKLKDWKISRSKRLGSLQYSLLASAIESCKSGGEIIYLTCSISPFENDEVIKKALKKKKEKIEVILEPIDELELTEFGYEVFPDRQQMGPLYISRIKVL